MNGALIFNRSRPRFLKAVADALFVCRQRTESKIEDEDDFGCGYAKL